MNFLLAGLLMLGSKNIYVAVNGNNNNDGFTEQTPKATVAAGIAMMSDHSTDRLLLHRGDTWHESLGQWKLSGVGEDMPMIVETYGDSTERPNLITGSNAGIFTMGGGNAPPYINHVIFRGIRFTGDNNTANGVNFIRSCRDVMLDDCYFEHYFNGIIINGFDGKHSDIYVRNCIVVDSYATNGNCQGLYASQTDGLVIDNCLFDHNGWGPGATPNIFRHNIYIADDNTNVIVRNCLISNGGSHGLQMRSGGIVDGNIFSRNAISLHCGGGLSPVPGGVTIQVTNNIIVDGKNIDDTNKRGWGMTFTNIRQGLVKGNYIANNTMGGMPFGIEIDNRSLPLTNITFSNNLFYKWGGTDLSLQGHDFQDIVFDHNTFFDSNYLIVGVDVTSPVFTSNTFFSSAARPFMVSQALTFAEWVAVANNTGTVYQAKEYVDPKRTLFTYGFKLLRTTNYDTIMQAFRDNYGHGNYTLIKVKRYIINGFQQ